MILHSLHAAQCILVQKQELWKRSQIIIHKNMCLKSVVYCHETYWVGMNFWGRICSSSRQGRAMFMY